MDLINKFIEKLTGKHTFFVLFFIILLSVYFVSLIEYFIIEYFTKIQAVKFIAITEVPNPLNIIIRIVLLLSFIKIFLFIWKKIILPLFLSIIRFFKNHNKKSILKISEWIFQGSFKIIGDSIEITSSNSGCLLKNQWYKNFIMSFNIQIKNGGHGGIVFRAQDLENYLMIQIVLADELDGSGTIIYDIIPHVRFEGNWETFNITPAFTNKPEPYYPTEIKYYSDMPVSLRVENNLVILTIKSNNSIEEFRWNIPTHTDSNIRQHLPDREKDNLLTKPDPFDGQFVRKIWFRSKYGMVGFRAHSWEKIVIKNLKIEEL